MFMKYFYYFFMRLGIACFSVEQCNKEGNGDNIVLPACQRAVCNFSQINTHWPTLTNLGQLGPNNPLANLDQLWQTLTNFDQLWQTLTNLDHFWPLLILLWPLLAVFGHFWLFLATFDQPFTNSDKKKIYSSKFLPLANRHGVDQFWQTENLLYIILWFCTDLERLI